MSLGIKTISIEMRPMENIPISWSCFINNFVSIKHFTVVLNMVGLNLLSCYCLMCPFFLFLLLLSWMSENSFITSPYFLSWFSGFNFFFFNFTLVDNVYLWSFPGASDDKEFTFTSVYLQAIHRFIHSVRALTTHFHSPLLAFLILFSYISPVYMLWNQKCLFYSAFKQSDCLLKRGK